MSSAFSGIEMGKRALAAHQQAIDVTGHNIANVNTPGYSRQEAILATTDPYTEPSARLDLTSGQFGTGVQMEAIRRIRADFLDRRARDAISRSGSGSQKSDWLTQAEAAFQEPGENGLNAALGRFWNAWQNVSKDPQNTATRAVMIEQAQSFAKSFRGVVGRLDQTLSDADKLLAAKLQELNGLTGRIASLNGKIRQVMALGQEPNDLLDMRDHLLDQLADLADFVQTNRTDGMVTVSIAGVNVVMDDQSLALTDASGIREGQIGGIAEARDIIQAWRDEVNSLASQIIQSVNARHRVGYDLDGNAGGDFFAGTDATDIAISADLLSDPRRVAAAQTLASTGPPPVPVPGDGSNALGIAQLQQQKLMDAGALTFGDYYTRSVSLLGSQVRSAVDESEGQKAYMDALTRQRESVSGVSLDEEMVNMVRFQRGYEAAAKLITTMAEMLDTIINLIGV